MSDVPSSRPASTGAGADAAMPVRVTGLRRSSLGLRHAIVISVAVMSPAASIFFNTIPQAGLVGAAVPLCYVVGFVVALLMASQYSEMSRELPSSGSAYTFVVEGIGPRWGFFTAWLGLIAIALGVPYSFILMSANLQVLVQRWVGINLHWSFWFVAAIGIIFALCYIGIRQSLTVDMTLLAFEMGICLVLALIVLVSVGGHGGLSAAPFNPNEVPKGGDLTVGIVLGVLSFIGFETAATLGEETRNPHRNIPRAVFGSMIVVGVFYVLMAYVATIGYGINNMVTGYANDLAPFDTIGRHFGGGLLASLLDVAGILSFFGAALAIVNGGSRILYTVGVDGLLPRWTAILHPTRRTPIGAITGLCILGLVSGIALGFAFTPTGAFSFLGTLDALFVILIYALVNVACIRFFWRKRVSSRGSLKSILLHIVFPILSTLIIAAIFLSALLSPGPGPLGLIPYVVGVWIVLGVGVLIALRGKFAKEEM
ncbi:MAG TPA: APC family permease [Ktedonobacteraceae bacterium]|nr:APC family permease [Ktedonobacteraceae bacterium]